MYGGHSLFVPEGQNESSPAIYCWEKHFCPTSAVGTAEDGVASDHPGSFSRPYGTELSDSRNPSNKLLGYFHFVPPGL